MKTFVILATILATTGLAAAESDDANNPVAYYGGANVSLGGQRALQAAIYVDGGMRIVDSPFFVRGQLQTGTSGDEGSHRQARAGIEYRSCAPLQWSCGYVGSDFGYQKDDVDDTPFTFGGDPQEPKIVHAIDAIAVPRAGVEFGRHVKLRAGIEAPLRLRLDTMDDDDHRRVGWGLALSAGLAFAF